MQLIISLYQRFINHGYHLLDIRTPFTILSFARSNRNISQSLGFSGDVVYLY